MSRKPNKWTDFCRLCGVYFNREFLEVHVKHHIAIGGPAMVQIPVRGPDNEPLGVDGVRMAILGILPSGQRATHPGPTCWPEGVPRRPATAGVVLAGLLALGASSCKTLDLNSICPAGSHIEILPPGVGVQCVRDAVTSSPTPPPPPTPSPSPGPTPAPEPPATPTPEPHPTLPPPATLSPSPPVAPTPAPTPVALCGVPEPPVAIPFMAPPCGAGYMPVNSDAGRFCLGIDACGRIPNSENNRCDLRLLEPPVAYPFPVDPICSVLDLGGSLAHGSLISKGMLCGPEYFDPSAGDYSRAQERGCSDALGRRVKYDGTRWSVVSPESWLGICVAKMFSSCPAPPPTAAPSATCSLGKMPECGADESSGAPEGQRVYGCCREAERRHVFLDKVLAAESELERTRPDLFESPGKIPPGSENRYVPALAALLTAKYGVCASQGGPADEVGVKDENGYSEQYDVVVGGDATHAPSIAANQTVTCRPARF
jgi:hypothetical protein